jgi:hypothetical protein
LISARGPPSCAGLAFRAASSSTKESDNQELQDDLTPM